MQAKHTVQQGHGVVSLEPVIQYQQGLIRALHLVVPPKMMQVITLVVLDMKHVAACLVYRYLVEHTLRLRGPRTARRVSTLRRARR